MEDFRSTFLWDCPGTIVWSFFKITSGETLGQKKNTQKPYLHFHQNNVPNALIEKDISETSICYLKEVRGQRNTSKISLAKG